MIEAVHPDDAGLDIAGHLVGGVQIHGPNGRGQPVDRVVGDGDGLARVREGYDGAHGAEDLLLGDLHLVLNAGEQRGRDVATGLEPLGHAAAELDLRPLLLAGLDVAEHALLLVAGDEGAHRCPRIEGVARDIGRLAQLLEFFDEFVVDAGVDEESRAGVAHLALIAEDTADSVLYGRVEVLDVGHDDLRGLAATLGGHALLVRLAGVDHHELADFDRPGERDLVDIHVQAQGFSSLFAKAVDHVEHPRRPAGLHEQLGHEQGAQRGLLGGLEHHRIAGGQRRRHLPGRHHQRVVPRHDAPDHAERLTQDIVERRRLRVGDLAVDLVDGLGEILEGNDRARDVDVEHVRNRLAHIERIEERELAGVRFDEPGVFVEHFHAVARRHP